jgi:hypothetical protein
MTQNHQKQKANQTIKAYHPPLSLLGVCAFV